MSPGLTKLDIFALLLYFVDALSNAYIINSTHPLRDANQTLRSWIVTSPPFSRGSSLRFVLQSSKVKRSKPYLSVDWREIKSDRQFGWVTRKFGLCVILYSFLYRCASRTYSISSHRQQCHSPLHCWSVIVIPSIEVNGISTLEHDELTCAPCHILIRLPRKICGVIYARLVSRCGRYRTGHAELFRAGKLGCLSGGPGDRLFRDGLQCVCYY